MKHDKHELTGKTFDQQLELVDGRIDGHETDPNRRIPGEVVLEPIFNGVRVTARDGDHRLLWGFIGSKDMLAQTHCQVAAYGALQDMLREELAKVRPPVDDAGEALQTALASLQALRLAIDEMETSIRVKKVSDATEERARAIARVTADALRMIRLETGSLRGSVGASARVADSPTQKTAGVELAGVLRGHDESTHPGPVALPPT